MVNYYISFYTPYDIYLSFLKIKFSLKVWVKLSKICDDLKFKEKISLIKAKFYQNKNKQTNLNLT